MFTESICFIPSTLFPRRCWLTDGPQKSKSKSSPVATRQKKRLQKKIEKMHERGLLFVRLEIGAGSEIRLIRYRACPSPITHVDGYPFTYGSIPLEECSRKFIVRNLRIAKPRLMPPLTLNRSSQCLEENRLIEKLLICYLLPITSRYI